MENKDLIVLQQEINRLHRVIDILVENNAQLKQTVCYYQQQVDRLQTPAGVHKSGADATNSLFYSNHPHVEVVKPSFCHIGANEDGVNKQLCPVCTKEDGVNKAFCATGTEKDGVKKSSCPICTQNDGVKTFSCTICSEMDGVKPNADAICCCDNEAKIESIYLHQSRSALITYNTAAGNSDIMAKTASTLPACHNNGLPTTTTPAGEVKTAVKQINMAIVASKLDATNPKSTYGGLYNTVDILMRLHQSPKQSLKDLQKLTGLSEDGIVKRIMAMKKRGLIVRAPGRRLLLTAKAQQMLEDARIY